MRIKRPVCVLTLVFMLAVWIFTLMSGGVDISEKIADDTKITIDGVIEDKEFKNFSNVVYIKLLSGSGGSLSSFGNADRFIFYLDKQEISDFRIGQSVRVSGIYSNFPVAENRGQFCMRTYYRIRGYQGRIKKAQVTHCSQGYDEYRDVLYNVKERTKRVYIENMSQDHYGTMSAMILGDKTGLDDDTKTLFQNAGISHILSLSGLHIATIGMFVFSLFIRAGLGVKLSSLFSTAVMVSYGIMTGLSTSTLRALIMFFLGIVAKCIGRTYDLLSAVCVSAIIILAENKLYIYDSGFLMSFLSVIGIGIIYPVLNEVTEVRDFKKIFCIYNSGRFSRDNGFNLFEAVGNLLSGIRQSLCISMSASLATLPVVASSFYKISRYSILVNIIIVPLMSVVLFLGIVGGILGNIGLHNISKLDLKAAEFVLGFFNSTSAVAGSIPGNTWVIGKPEIRCIVVYIIILVPVFTGIGRKLCDKITCLFIFSNNIEHKISKNKASGCHANSGIVIPVNNNSNTDKKKQRKVFRHLYFWYTLIMVAAALFCISYRTENDISIDVLSVGQGACNVIHGNDVPTVMIDAGSTDVKEVGKYRVIPNLLSKGIDEIDYLFVTHPDEDHINAVKELLSDKSSGIKVDAVVFSILDDETAAFSDEYSVPVYSFNAGQVISGNDYEIRAIYPAYREGVTWKSVDANENSLVLKLTHKPSGFTALFTGDIGKQTENEILDNNKTSSDTEDMIKQNMNGNVSSGMLEYMNDLSYSDHISNVAFMTAAHHGSKNSNSEQFIAHVNPLLCTISAGKDNSYGHPHKETLETLNNYNIPYVITYETGEINVNINSGKVWVEKFVK